MVFPIYRPWACRTIYFGPQGKRKKLEKQWINKLSTKYPNGLNEQWGCRLKQERTVHNPAGTTLWPWARISLFPQAGYVTKKESKGVLQHMTMTCPPESPDLNPTDALGWARMKQNQPSVQHVWGRIQDCWKIIQGDDSWSCTAAIKAKGTKI